MHLDEWGLGGRGFGTFVPWFLLGGDLYTAYTFIAVPALVYAVPANGGFVITRNGYPHGVCATAVSVACVTGYLDSSTAAPTTGVFVQISVSN